MTRVAVTTDRYWRLPENDPPPLGQKLHLLTKGHVAVHGFWKGDGTYLAWEPMPKIPAELKAKK